jgi:hypothetical protein
MKPLTTVLSVVGKGLKGRNGRTDVHNTECKTIQNYHNPFPLYNEYVLMKMKKRNKILMIIISLS